MFKIRLSSKEKTFGQRFKHDLIFAGIPLALLELIGIPPEAWFIVLPIVLPATIAGVFVAAVIEHGIFRYLRGRQADRQTPERK